MNLDHVAIAAHDAVPPLRALVGSLGATVEKWGATDGFRAVQARVGPGGMTIEIIEPFTTDRDDFLERYLARHGEGLHHLTFTTDDLGATARRLAASGYEPAVVRLDNPVQRELFLPPALAHGTVVQIVERVMSTWDNDHGPVAHPAWWGDLGDAANPAAVLQRAVLAARSLADAGDLFVTLLGGSPTPVERHTIDVSWEGGTVRLVETPGPLGLHHLECVRAGLHSTVVAAGATITVHPPAHRTLNAPRQGK